MVFCVVDIINYTKYHKLDIIVEMIVNLLYCCQQHVINKWIVNDSVAIYDITRSDVLLTSDGVSVSRLYMRHVTHVTCHMSHVSHALQSLLCPILRSSWIMIQ